MRPMMPSSSIVLAMLLLAAPATAQPSQGDREGRGFYIGVHAGFGIGSLLDVIDENCGNFDGAFGLECSGDDRGPVWALGVDARWAMNRFLDLGLRAEYAKPSDITLEATGIFEGIPLETMLRGDGSLANFAGQLGVSVSERFRLYSGYGASRFDFDITATFTAFGQTQTQTDNASGWGHHFYAGAEYVLRPRLSLFGEGGRSWLKDESGNAEAEDFDEKYSRWIAGARLELTRPRRR
jgi:predicted porin